MHLFLGILKEMKPCIQHPHYVGGRTINTQFTGHVQTWYQWGTSAEGDGRCTGHSSGCGFPIGMSYHAS